MKKPEELIQKLLEHPDSVLEDEIVAELVVMYSQTQELQSLAELLRSEDTIIRRVAAIVSVNLGVEACLLVDDLKRLQSCDDGETRRSAIRVVYLCTDMTPDALIDGILSNPDKAANDGLPNILIDEYHRGLQLETLRPLLLSDDSDVQSIASFILSELGGTACELIDEIDHLLTNPHSIVRGDAIDFAWQCSFEYKEFREYFVVVTDAMSDSHIGNRLRAMNLVRRASDDQLKVAIIHYSKSGIGETHQIGLRLLLTHDVTPEALREVIEGSDSLLRKYAVISLVKRTGRVADKLNLKFIEDVDVTEFSAQQEIGPWKK